MSVYYTTKITKEEAIERITDKRIEKTKEEIKYSLSRLSDTELEELLEDINEREFENFSIVKENKQ